MLRINEEALGQMEMSHKTSLTPPAAFYRVELPQEGGECASDHEIQPAFSWVTSVYTSL